MKLFYVGEKKPKRDELELMYEAEISKTRIALFNVRLELESAQEREARLVKRLDRLTRETDLIVKYPPLYKVS